MNSTWRPMTVRDRDQEITISSPAEALAFMNDWPWARGYLFERAKHLCELAGRPAGKPAVAQLAFRAAIGEVHMFPDVRVRSQMAPTMWS